MLSQAGFRLGRALDGWVAREGDSIEGVTEYVRGDSTDIQAVSNAA